MPIAAIDRVEVVRGATGDLYGADALGGVIQVLTLDANRPRVRALFDGGSQETARASAFGGRRFGNWLVSAGGEFQNTAGAFVVEERGARRGGRARPTAITAPASRPPATTAAAGARRCASTAPPRIAATAPPLQVNDTEWRQVSGDVNGAARRRFLDGPAQRRHAGVFSDVLGRHRRSRRPNG